MFLDAGLRLGFAGWLGYKYGSFIIITSILLRVGFARRFDDDDFFLFWGGKGEKCV